MKALLVHPFHTYSSHLIYSSEPIGLLYLATYAEEQTEWDIEILDLYALGGGKRERSGEVFHFGLSDEHQIGRLIKVGIPPQIDHLFRRKSSTDSAVNRPPIPA